MSEHCSICGGPTEVGRALSDSLAGIEAEIEAGCIGELDWDNFMPALSRLFNGCAACGREPLYQQGFSQGRTQGELGPRC